MKFLPLLLLAFVLSLGVACASEPAEPPPEPTPVPTPAPTATPAPAPASTATAAPLPTTIPESLISSAEAKARFKAWVEEQFMMWFGIMTDTVERAEAEGCNPATHFSIAKHLPPCKPSRVESGDEIHEISLWWGSRTLSSNVHVRYAGKGRWDVIIISTPGEALNLFGYTKDSFEHWHWFENEQVEPQLFHQEYLK